MCRPLLEPFNPGINYRLRCIEVGFPDFQMDDIAALTFQFGGAAEHLKGGLAPHFVHSLCDPRSRIQLQSIYFLERSITLGLQLSWGRDVGLASGSALRACL